MEKSVILQELKSYFEKNGNHSLLNFQESDIDIGSTQNVFCRKFKYVCTAAGQKFGGDFRFPLTKTYDSEAKWFFEGNKTLATNFLIAYIGSKDILDELGGVFEEVSYTSAIESDAYWKLRNDFRMYDCQVLPETIRIDDWEETYISSPIFNPIFLTTADKKELIGYIVKNSVGEKIILDLNQKHKKKKEKDDKPNWFIIILGIFWFPILIVYLIYYFGKKKK